MKRLSKIVVALVAVLLIAGAAEARGVHFVRHTHHIRHTHHVRHVRRGIRRGHWGRHFYSKRYGRVVFTDPALPGAYYWSESDRLYYPVTELEVPAPVPPAVTLARP